MHGVNYEHLRYKQKEGLHSRLGVSILMSVLSQQEAGQNLGPGLAGRCVSVLAVRVSTSLPRCCLLCELFARPGSLSSL